jgi:hypothetical protein
LEEWNINRFYEITKRKEMKASELRIGNFVYQEQTIDDLEIVEAGLGTQFCISRANN